MQNIKLNHKVLLIIHSWSRRSLYAEDLSLFVATLKALAFINIVLLGKMRCTQKNNTLPKEYWHTRCKKRNFCWSIIWNDWATFSNLWSQVILLSCVDPLNFGIMWSKSLYVMEVKYGVTKNAEFGTIAAL